MAEEVQSGQPAPSTPPEAPAPAPVEQPAPAEVPEAPPTKYGGKTLEELTQEAEQKDRYISELAERAARAEHEATFTRNLIEQFGMAKNKQVETPAEAPEVTDDEFLTNPAKATSKIIESYFARDRAERERKEKEQYVQYAKSNYESGRNTALKQSPRLFQGIEADVSREVFSAFEQNKVTADALRDPNFWEATAAIIRFTKGERNLEKYYHSTPKPMTATPTETPSPSTPPKGDESITPEQEELIRRTGITRERFLASRTKVREITEARQQ